MPRQRQTVTVLLELTSAGLMPAGRLGDLDLEGLGVGIPLLELILFEPPPPPPTLYAPPRARTARAAFLPSLGASLSIEVPTGHKVPVPL